MKTLVGPDGREGAAGGFGGEMEPAIVDSLQALAQHTRELDELSQVTLEEYASALRVRRSVERALHLVVESGVDAAIRVLMSPGRPSPERGRPAIRDLQALAVVDADLAGRLFGHIGVRDRMGSPDAPVGDATVHGAARLAVGDFGSLLRRLVDTAPAQE